MPRESIKFTTDELRSFLKPERRAILATLAPDSKAWGDAVACVFMDDRLYFRVPTKTKSLANIRRDPRVCCTVETHPLGAAYYTIKGAMLHGKADEVKGDAAKKVKPVLDKVPDPVEPSRTDGVIFSVGIDDVASFDFGKIRFRYEPK